MGTVQYETPHVPSSMCFKSDPKVVNPDCPHVLLELSISLLSKFVPKILKHFRSLAKGYIPSPLARILVCSYEEIS